MEIRGLSNLGVRGIKILSTGLMISAIAWELGNLYAHSIHLETPHSLDWIFWVGRSAMIIHFIEALIGFYYAPSQGKNPINYAIYTFFVGTIGLVELKSVNSKQ